MPSPVVTGVSPKEGPPGTRVTIRGEFLGTSETDIIGVEICGSDCILSTEWKSPNKIIARSGPGKGRGEIIVTTGSGGRGTCTVEFRGYHERIGPLKETAVWVDEISPIGAGPWSKSSSFQVEDPLGLSVEANDTKKLPEDDLQELFPGCNGDLSSEQFSPGWFLLQHHQTTSFDDLRIGLSYLRRKVEGHKEGQLSFLKGNVSSVVEQLEVLEALQAVYHSDVKQHGLDVTSKIVQSVDKSMEEGKLLFDGVLKGKEKADRTRNALGVLQRFKFLFTLPAAMDRNLKRGDYDAIISDYSRAYNLFGKTEVGLFKKVLFEVDSKIIQIKEVLKKKLHTMPASLDNRKRIIRNLVQLEYEGDPGWEAITVHLKYINDQLAECYRFHMANAEKLNSSDKSSKSKKEKLSDKKTGVHERVDCIVDLCGIVSLLLPQLWSLGQFYFSGELYSKPDQSKLAEFKTNAICSISEMCRLIRTSVGPGKSPLTGWYPKCLKHLRKTASHLSQIPYDPLTALIHYFRMECVKSALTSCADQVKELIARENWCQIHEPKFGLITELPKAFETVVATSMDTVKDALGKEPKEIELFDSEPLQKETGQLFLIIFNNYIECIENLAANGEDEQSMVVSQMGTTTFRQNLASLSWEERLLSCICNVRYSYETTLPSLCRGATSAGFPQLNWVLDSATLSLKNLKSRLEFSYIEAKSDPLVGTIEPSMYIGHFEWDTDLEPTTVRPYANEIIANLVAVDAQLERCCSWLKESVLAQIVETVAEEVSRLFLCVAKMSPQGSQQAKLDVLALEFALTKYTSQSAQRFFTEALESIKPLTPQQDKFVHGLLDKYKKTMKLQLYAFVGN